MPAEYYRSPEVYRRESETIFHRRWLPAGRADALTAPGEYRLLELEGEQLILVRDAGGQVRAHFNVCRHRGTRLCEEAQGRFARSIRCPYHGWTYDWRGRLVGAPNMPADFDKPSYSLRPAELAEWAGFLFVHLEGDPPPLAEALAPLAQRCTGWRLAELRVAHQEVYEVAANWKLLFQNYSECYHCPTLHPHLNRLTPYRDSSNDLEEGPILGGPMRLEGAAGSMTVGGSACAPPLSGDPDVAGRAYYYTIFPGFFLSLFPDYVLTHRLERLEIDRTRVTCQWLFAPEALGGTGFDPGPAVEFWDLTNRQDWHICELAQQGIGSRAYVPGPYSDLESMLGEFDRYYLGVLG